MILCHRSLDTSSWPTLFQDGTKGINDLSEWGGRGTDSGVSVTAKTALNYHPVWKAVNLLGSSIARCPCHAYRRAGEGKERADELPGAFLVRREPAPGIPAPVWYMTAMGHVTLRGNHYSYIVRNPAGDPVELWPLDPTRVTPVLESKDGKAHMWYVYQPSGGGLSKLYYDNVIHIRGLGFDGLAGYSVIEHARNCLGLGMAAEKYSNKYFANNAEARVVLTVPGWLTPEQQKQIIDGWGAMHKGLDKPHGTALLQGGMDVKHVSINARDSQLLESMDFSIRAAANWFMMPPHKLGDNSRTAYNSIEAENQAFLDEAIDFWLVLFEAEFSAKLLTTAQYRGGTHYYEFSREALVRANLQTRALYYRQALSGAAWMTKNEVRAAENMNEVPNGAAVVDPANNFGPQAPPAEPPPEPPPPARAEPPTPSPEETAARQAARDRANAIREASRAAFDDIRRRMETRVSKAYEARRKRGDGIDAARQYVATGHSVVMHEALFPTARALCLLTGADADTFTRDTTADIIAKLGD